MIVHQPKDTPATLILAGRIVRFENGYAEVTLPHVLRELTARGYRITARRPKARKPKGG